VSLTQYEHSPVVSEDETIITFLSSFINAPNHEKQNISFKQGLRKIKQFYPPKVM
jgi:hypothetical protein